MAEQFAFFKNGLSDKAFVKYMDYIQDEVATYFGQEWGDEGEADLLQSLSDLFTLTSSRCLLGEEIRQRWKASGMAEHYCKYCFVLPYIVATRTSSIEEQCTPSDWCASQRLLVTDVNSRLGPFLCSHPIFLSMDSQSTPDQVY